MPLQGCGCLSQPLAKDRFSLAGRNTESSFISQMSGSI